MESYWENCQSYSVRTLGIVATLFIAAAAAAAGSVCVCGGGGGPVSTKGLPNVSSVSQEKPGVVVAITSLHPEDATHNLQQLTGQANCDISKIKRGLGRPVIFRESPVGQTVQDTRGLTDMINY